MPDSIGSIISQNWGSSNLGSAVWSHSLRSDPFVSYRFGGGGSSRSRQSVDLNKLAEAKARQEAEARALAEQQAKQREITTAKELPAQQVTPMGLISGVYDWTKEKIVTPFSTFQESTTQKLKASGSAIYHTTRAEEEYSKYESQPAGFSRMREQFFGGLRMGGRFITGLWQPVKSGKEILETEQFYQKEKETTFSNLEKQRQFLDPKIEGYSSRVSDYEKRLSAYQESPTEMEYSALKKESGALELQRYKLQSDISKFNLDASYLQDIDKLSYKTPIQKTFEWGAVGSATLASSYLIGLTTAPVIGSVALRSGFTATKTAQFIIKHPKMVEGIAFTTFGAVPSAYSGYQTYKSGGDTIDILGSASIPLLTYGGFRAGAKAGTDIFKNYASERILRNQQKFYELQSQKSELSQIRLFEETRNLGKGLGATRQKILYRAEITNVVPDETISTMYSKPPELWKTATVGKSVQMMVDPSKLIRSSPETIFTKIKMTSPKRGEFVSIGQMTAQERLGTLKGDPFKLLEQQTGKVRVLKDGQIIFGKGKGTYTLQPYEPADFGIKQMFKIDQTSGLMTSKITGERTPFGTYKIKAELTDVSYFGKGSTKSIEYGTEYYLKGFTRGIKDGKTGTILASDYVFPKSDPYVTLPKSLRPREYSGTMNVQQTKSFIETGSPTTYQIGQSAPQSTIIQQILKQSAPQTMVVLPQPQQITTQTIQIPSARGGYTSPKMIYSTKDFVKLGDYSTLDRDFVKVREITTTKTIPSTMETTTTKEITGVKTITEPMATTFPIEPTPMPITPIPFKFDIPKIPKIPIFPIIPLFDSAYKGGFSFGGGSRRQPFKYQPSVSAMFLGIKGKAPKTLTGLELRPIILKKKKKK